MNRSRWALAGAVLYAVFLVTAPFTHHDLDCELKHPLHCTACTSSVLRADPNPPATPGANDLVAAGTAHADLIVPEDLQLAISTTGRSPPALV